jgi:drug/metabolite transporter (DMT)-like permease
MIYFILVIVLNTLLSVLFKIFPKYNIDTFQAIVFNYITCVITGTWYLGAMPFTTTQMHAAWLPYAIIMGIAFISVFNLIGYCTKTIGITATTISNKLSLIIPVIISIIAYNETSTTLRIIGILLAIPAVYFSSKKTEKADKQNSWKLIALLFLLSGLLDSFVKFVETTFLNHTEDQAFYTIYVFSTAAIIGMGILIQNLIRKKTKFELKNVIAGCILGIPNYFSIYFFIKLLNSHIMNSSAIIPIANIGVVVCAAIAALFLFKERMNKVNTIGLLLGIAAILLIAFEDLF